MIHKQEFIKLMKNDGFERNGGTNWLFNIFIMWIEREKFAVESLIDGGNFACKNRIYGGKKFGFP
jgi:hypothetical protein